MAGEMAWRPVLAGLLLAVCGSTLPTCSAGGQVGNLPPQDWPSWRGPTGMGHTNVRDLPLTWGGKDAVNVLWKAALFDDFEHARLVARAAIQADAEYRAGARS